MVRVASSGPVSARPLFLPPDLLPPEALLSVDVLCVAVGVADWVGCCVWVWVGVGVGVGLGVEVDAAVNETTVGAAPLLVHVVSGSPGR